MATPEVHAVDTAALRAEYLKPGGSEKSDFSIHMAQCLDEIDALRARVALAESSAPDIFDAAVKEQRKRRALEQEIDRLTQLVCDFQAAAMIEVGGVGDPSLVEPKHVEKYATDLQNAAEKMAEALRQTAGLVDEAMHPKRRAIVLEAMAAYEKVKAP